LWAKYVKKCKARKGSSVQAVAVPHATGLEAKNGHRKKQASFSFSPTEPLVNLEGGKALDVVKGKRNKSP
jgi:hypothetical protein